MGEGRRWERGGDGSREEMGEGRRTFNLNILQFNILFLHPLCTYIHTYICTYACIVFNLTIIIFNGNITSIWVTNDDLV